MQREEIAHNTLSLISHQHYKYIVLLKECMALVRVCIKKSYKYLLFIYWIQERLGVALKH